MTVAFDNQAYWVCDIIDDVTNPGSYLILDKVKLSRVEPDGHSTVLYSWQEVWKYELPVSVLFYSVVIHSSEIWVSLP